MRRIIPRTILTTILITGLAGIELAQDASAQTPRVGAGTVTVSGKGTVKVQPDQATVRFGVVTVDLDPEAARVDNARVSAATMNAVRELGIEDRKIQVNVLRIQPYREYDPDTRRNVDMGFQAVRDVTVDLEDLDLLPSLIASIVGEGANRIHGISYGLQDETGPEHEALQEALVNARAKAELMVKTLGARLGSVIQVSEQGLVRPQQIRMEFDRSLMQKDAGMSEVIPEAYSSGEIDVSANVTVVFAILPARSRQ